MPSAAAHLDDLAARLRGNLPGVGERVYCSRLRAIDPTEFPVVCLYAPESHSGEAPSPSMQPQYQPTHQLAVEVRCAEADGFDAQAAEILDAALDLLLRDQAWLARYKRYPAWTRRQYLERRPEQSFCGEVLTLTVRDGKPTAYPPRAPDLAAIGLTVKVKDQTAAAITLVAAATDSATPATTE